MAFAVTNPARLLLSPTRRRASLTTRQASLDAADRSVAPPTGLLTLGFDPAVSPRAASLLPGLLAATRTGLTPAGDDELMSDHDHIIDLQLWAHSVYPTDRNDGLNWPHCDGLNWPHLRPIAA